ncbi:endonuclease/exonuclease/phosphatase family protein [Sulfitobacter pontiacus]|uniref:endonuclease/exonuclease/phosphatase family protein n=1 Tax=Sulfitobacter pontiacus TaxID=60137 RepID=UPI0030ED4BDC
MRIATYNVEWFTGLFDDEDQLLLDDGWSARHNITRAQQAQALGTVFRAMDADAVMVIEAPDQSRKRGTVAALERFAAHFDLRTRKAVIGFANDTQQEIALLFDPDRLSASHAPGGSVGQGDAPRFDGTLDIDLDIDAREDHVVFSKPPLELDIVTREGVAFHMIGAHLKSKAPHGAKTPQDALRIGIANRRKQLAQAIWLRRRIDAQLDDDTPLMVLGDLNDGPGLDSFEDLFGRSSVEIVMGHRQDRALVDPHATRALGQRIGAMPTTSRFWIAPEKRYLQALLDYIMISPSLTAYRPQWRIWHPLDDPECWGDAALRDALITASDHFPVTIDLDLSTRL